MYSMGVHPPIASLLKLHEYANAHASLPSMNSGEPLMPIAMPESASLGSSDLTMMMSIFGSMFLTMPTTSNSKRSGAVPWKTVSP